jgi:hypothetical protein
MSKGDEAILPDGVSESCRDPGIGGWWSIIRLVVIGSLLLVAAIGVLGTGSPEPVRVRTPQAQLVIESPSPLRNGMFFETRVSVRPDQDVQDAVIAVSADVWRDVTINTMIPSPAEEGFDRGYFLFHFGPLGPGEELTFKLDGQINPSRQADHLGSIEFRDGERPLARAAYGIKVIG